MPSPRPHGLLLAAMVLLAAGAEGQQDEPRDRSSGVPGAVKPPGFSAPMVVLLVALVVTFFFIGFFSIYMRRCGRARSTGPTIPAAALRVLSHQEQRQRGIDPAVVASFPIMTYAEARKLRDGVKDTVVECAVCLSEFDGHDELRLLPKCSHAFHPDCIGEWLAGHLTCPVCRCSLVPQEPATAAEASSSGEVDAGQQEDVAIDVNCEDGDEEERRREAMDLARIASQRRAVRSRSVRPLPRSHSTGHSLTTRLHRDLQESLHQTGPRVGRGDGARGARIGRSERWPSFIARTFSSRVPFRAPSRRTPDVTEPEGAVARPTTPRLVHEKTTATVDGSVCSAKGSSVRFDCLGHRVVAGDSDEDDEKGIVRCV